MDKLKKIFYKIIYILEFVFCLSEAFLALYVVNDILNNKIDYLKIIISIILGIVILAIIVISIKKSDKKIEKIFITFAIPISLLFLVFLLPTYVPDENYHAMRAYEVGNGELIIKYNDNGETTTYIPEDLIYSGIDGGVNTYSKLVDNMNSEANYSESKPIFNASQSYFPTLYIFSGIGFFIGKIFSLNFIITMYIARILNLIAGLILGYYSIKIIPFGKLLLATYMFLPMYFQQEMSMSADSLINSVALFFIAYNLYLIYKSETFTLKSKIFYIILSIFLSLGKIVYLPLVFLSVLLLKNKNYDKKKIIKFIIIVLGTTIILGCIWYIFSSGYKDQRTEYLLENNVNGGEQIKWILKNPISYIKVLLYTSLSQGNVYLEQFIGAPLGWLNIPIEGFIIKMFFVMLIITPFLEKSEYNIEIRERIFYLILFLMVTILAITGLYIGWSTVGGKMVLGFQGRYLLPIMILPLLCLCNKEKNIEFKNTNTVSLIFLSVLNLGVIVQVMKFFI